MGPTIRRIPAGHAIILVLLALLSTQTRAFAESDAHPRSITVGIDDYAELPAAEIAAAQQKVSELYKRIGVEIDWLETRNPLRTHGRPTAPQLVVIVLGEPMSDQIGAPEACVGLAPGTTTSRGRLAYVFSDRVRRLAARLEDALGMVIAHEIGHLLLPFGSHTPSGVMRGFWPRDLFRQSASSELWFNAFQGEEIRQSLAASGISQ